MDDPHLQRAIYASIQTARSQGYYAGQNKGGGQSYRTPVSITRGDGNGAGRGGGGIHSSSRSYNVINRSQPQPRSYAGNSLPGMGPSINLNNSHPSPGRDTTRHLRSSYGRIEALRRDGIVPAAGGPALHPPPPLSASNFASSSSSVRPLPSAVPPRLSSTPPRTRISTGAHSKQPAASRSQQNTQRGVAHGRQPPPSQHQRLRQPVAHPVLEAIACATADAHAAFEAAIASPAGVAGALVSPLNTTLSLPSPSIIRSTTTSNSYNDNPTTATSTTNPNAATSAAMATGTSSVSGAGSGAGAAEPGPAHAPVGGNAPPPRSLVPMATGGPGGGVVMVPEGVDPLLAQAVLRDAVTWDTGVSFDDIAGCDGAKRLLHEAVALPLIIPEFFTGIREPWRGVLLHGPPGCGKTLLAKAVAGMVGGAFFAVSPASLTSKWRGESEKLLATLFAVAQAHAPAIIFIDEVDAFGVARGVEGEHEASRRFKAELLQQMDGLSSGRGVMVLAATNCPWDLDPALRRRLEKRIHIGLPDSPQRLALLRLHLRGVTLGPDVDLGTVAEAAEGFSGADIRLLCRDAAMAPLRRQISGLALPQPSPTTPSLAQAHAPHAAADEAINSTGPSAGGPAPLVLRSAADIRRLADSGELALRSVLTSADLMTALRSVRPSVGADQAERYRQWDREFAST